MVLAVPRFPWDQLMQMESKTHFLSWAVSCTSLRSVLANVKQILSEQIVFFIEVKAKLSFLHPKQFQRCVTECLIILKSTLWGDEDLKHKIIDL